MIALAATAVGSGAPLVTLHASGMSSRQFGKLAAEAQASFTVHGADLLGVGRTPMPEERPYSLEAETDALLALLASLGEPAFVFGHSFGGLVALEAALREPARVRALALFEPVIMVLAERSGSERARAEIARIEEATTLDVRQGLEPWLEWFIDWWNGPGFYRGLPEPARAQFLATAHEAHRQAGVVMTSTVSEARLRELSVPTLFLTGETSPAAARESASLAQRFMPRASLVTVRGAGHMGPLTHAAAVNAEVLRFFRSLLEGDGVS
jgi:pimeloyl-ACP methyl ester carboxylesterase